MLNISGTLLSYVDRGLSTTQTNLKSSSQAEYPIDNSTISTVDNVVNISEQARTALLKSSAASEQQFLDNQLAASNERSAQQKVQAQDNLSLFIANAQRYSQLDTTAIAIENRQAINTYSLIENKVIATTNSNALES